MPEDSTYVYDMKQGPLFGPIPEAGKYLVTIGTTPFPSTPREFGAFQEAATRRWAEIVETASTERK